MDRGKGTSSCSKKKSKGNNMDLEEILREYALRYLPAKTLCRCLNVCRDWKLKISTPFFIHEQSTSFRAISGLFIQFPGTPPYFISLDQMAYGVPDPELNFLPEPVDVRASSNGLLCCQGRTGNMPYFVCNPVNQQWREIPKHTANHGRDPAIVLVFEPSSLNFIPDYKLICIFPSSKIDEAYEFEIYSSAQDSWKVHGEMVFSSAITVFFGGICLNGTAYWPGNPWKIAGFDLKSEQAVDVYRSNKVNEFNGKYVYQFTSRSSLGVMNGKICWTYAYLWRIIVNEFNGKYSDTSSWKITHQFDLKAEDFNVSRSAELQVLMAWDNVVVFQIDRRVYSYNLVSRQTIFMGNGPKLSIRHAVFPYVNSLVSLI